MALKTLLLLVLSYPAFQVMERRLATTLEPDSSRCYFFMGLRVARTTKRTERSVIVRPVPIQLSVELGPGGKVFGVRIAMDVVSAFSSVPAYVMLAA